MSFFQHRLLAWVPTSVMYRIGYKLKSGSIGHSWELGPTLLLPSRLMKSPKLYLTHFTRMASNSRATSCSLMEACHAKKWKGLGTYFPITEASGEICLAPNSCCLFGRPVGVLLGEWECFYMFKASRYSWVKYFDDCMSAHGTGEAYGRRQNTPLTSKGDHKYLLRDVLYFHHKFYALI